MFNNNYERNLLGKFNILDENKNNQIKYQINNNLDQKQLSKNLFFDNVNLFNQSHSNNNINRNLPEKNNIYNKNSFIHNSEKKSRDLNYTNYSKFYGETNNQPYTITNEAYNNNINNFKNIHNLNTINNNYQNPNLIRYNDIYLQNNESSLTNISNEYNNNIYSSQQRRSYSEINRRNTPINIEFNTIQNKNKFFNNRIINYSDQNFYNVRNNINQFYNNNSKYEKQNLNQSSPITNISNDIINNNMDYNSSNNTINNFYEQIQREKERKQKEDYSQILRQQIEEKRKRKELERQKEKEYDLKMERQYQEYLKKQKEMENNESNLFENNAIKRSISNREKPINDIFNQNNNINSTINNSNQNVFQTLEPENRKNLTNYNNFNKNNINEETTSRNKRTTTSSSSFMNSGKGIIDSFNKKPKTVDEFNKALNINNIEFSDNNERNLNTQNNNINNISGDKFGFTFKNKVETEEMIDKIIKEADDYLQGTLQQTFTNKEEKEKILYKELNNDQNPNKKIEFKGTFGTNQMNQSLEKTAQFNNNNNINNNIQNQRIENKKKNNYKLKVSYKKDVENNFSPRKLLSDNQINDKKDEIKTEKKNSVINIDELLKGIDLKALNYHSKYEENDENKNTIKNNSNQENQDKKMEESMKSVSKLVSSKKNNETWKEENIKANPINEEDSEKSLQNIKNENNDNNKREIKNNDIKTEKKDEMENKKKIMNFLSNRKEKKIKYKLGKKLSSLNEPEININTETKQQAVNQSIKLNGSLNPNLKITFGNQGNLLSNQSIEFNQDKSKIKNLSKITFGQNLENMVKNNNTSIQNMNESEIVEKNFYESLDEDEKKFDIKIKDENEINYDDMLNKNDDLKFLDFDNFLDISKINKNKNDIDDLCTIRYTPEEEQKQNKKVNEALKEAKDSSIEEEINNEKEEENRIQNMVNFSGENTLKLNYNKNKIKHIEKENQNAGEEKNKNENLLNNIKPDLNTEKESGKDDINSSGEKDLVNDESEKNDDIKNSDKEINDNEDENNIPDD